MARLRCDAPRANPLPAPRSLRRVLGVRSQRLRPAAWPAEVAAGAAVGPPPPRYVAWSAGSVACASSPGSDCANAARVGCKPGPVPTPGRPGAGEDHSSRRRIAAALEHSYPDAGIRTEVRCFGRATLDSVPIRACSGRGLPRRRSPGCRAWALTPRFHPYLCLRSVSSQSPSLNGHRRCIFCGAFPRVTPGRR